MHIYIWVVYFTLVSGDNRNRRMCDPNSSMAGGCHLLDYSNTWITTKCASGYVMTVSGECVTPCSTGNYLFGNTCASCAPNCANCSGPLDSDCSACTSQYAPNFQGICTFSCKIEDALYGLPPNTTSTNSKCYNCDGSCATCFHGYDTSCTSCPLVSGGTTVSLVMFDYSVGRTNAGYCVTDPQSLYANYFREYPKDNVVVQCPRGCATCTNSYQCTSCNRGYSLYPAAGSGAGYALCYQDPVQ
jgi:hypothetical protein